VVVDPRAGHGPGIGGMRQDSEIGVALAAGHPCYFVGFLPEPVPGQTIEDVCRAEAAFVEEVAGLHPDAEGKPVIVANCQAGWQIMMMAAIRPDLCGPIVLAGSPLSYWAGVRGRNPMRYLGGTLGGTWLTALSGDLGNGIFDGANLVSNFESLNPANTYWQKAYNLYSKVDTESSRFLDFETWWGNPVLLNASEMQWIADNLFVGNKLTSGEICTSDGVRVDLRNVQSPIVVLCSWGDNITPPQQALGWIVDLYDQEDEIVENGQTIVYTLHQTIGHLGIFVSGKVATKEHAEFASCMEMIDVLPPGLYEAVITEVDDTTAHADLIHGKYLFRLESRKLDDIRALVANNPEDDRRFAAAARLSEINNGLYRTLLQPVVKAMTTEQSAASMRDMHPSRLRFAAFSDRSPAASQIEQLATAIRADRKPVGDDNPLRAWEQVASTWISSCWENYRLARDAATEAAFLAAYGSPLLQAFVGLGAGDRPSAARDLVREANIAHRQVDLEKRFGMGGLPAAVIRSIMYIRMPQETVDERGFAVLQAVRRLQPVNRRLPAGEIKALFRDQYLLLRLDEERAIGTLPRLLPDDASQRETAWQAIRDVIAASGNPPDGARLRRIEEIFSRPGLSAEEESHA
jgi:pimeloyl-ACP methyl ester carboxylesterase